MRLNPHYPSSYPYERGLARFGLGRLDEAATSLERAIALKPDDYWSQRLLLGDLRAAGSARRRGAPDRVDEAQRHSAALARASIR